MREPIRLQKYLAQCGVCSRRKAEEYIVAGRVKVDGQVANKLGTKIVAGRSKVECDGRMIQQAEKLVYFLLNKPKGYVTTVSDPQGRPTVLTFFDSVAERLFPVGRLDLDSEGALLMTNDGELAQKILHPRFEVFKTYQVTIRNRPSNRDIATLEKGFMLEGKKTAPARVRFLRRAAQTVFMEIVIHEGRKHQVKKMFKHVGHPVLSLKRTAYGHLTLNNLKLGNYRRLGSSEIKKIFF